MNQEILELKLKGYCCSQIIMGLGLKRLNKENPDLIAAMAGLCNGMWMGKTCGIISAAVCLFYLADPEQAGKNAEELLEWFEEHFESMECHALIGDNPLNKVEKCPLMLEASFQKIAEMMDWED